MIHLRTILHPTDLSDPSENAFRVARMIARESDAKLVVLYVAYPELTAPPVVYSELGNSFMLPEDRHDLLAHVKSQLHDRFERDSDVRVETRLAEGDAADEILRLAEELPCDLIVMGTHGRSGLDRLLMGSVAESVLRRAGCPVLTVKSPSKAYAPDRHEAATA